MTEKAGIVSKIMVRSKKVANVMSAKAVPFMVGGLLFLSLNTLAWSRSAYETVPPVLEMGAVRVEVPREYKNRVEFRDHVQSVLDEMEDDRYVRQILHAAKNAPVAIVIAPMTDNPATWNNDGSRTRSHTEPRDSLPKKYGRHKPTPGVVFIYPDRINPKRKAFGSGTLPHELVHAIDLAYGRYHRKAEIRERRAVFVQNIWRQLYGYRLRDSYHGRFPTLEYQVAKRNGTIERQLDYIFTGSAFPLPGQR